MSDSGTDENGTLPGGIATGVGSWPGDDIREATATVVGELGDLPHLVELPGRGVGADMIGRASALLVDMRFDTTTRGYRLAARSGAVARRARDFLRQDLDTLEEAWETAGLTGTGRTIKVQAVGPLTLAAQVELPLGHRILTDSGALRDLSESLAEGLAKHVTEIGKRLGAKVIVQLDEPMLNVVLEGSLQGPSVMNTVRALPAPEAQHILDAVITAQPAPVLVHSCEEPPALAFLRGTAAAGVGFDLATIHTPDLDHIGELLESGRHLALGLIPTTAPTAPATWRELAEPGARLMDRLGFPRRRLATHILVTPSCGLANTSLDWARKSLTLATEIAAAYADEPEALTFD